MMPIINFKRKKLELNQPCWVGILNITPDSFSDGNQFLEPKQAWVQTEKMLSEGAHIIDMGAESSRPGAKQVSVEEELKRLIPVLKMIRQNSDCLISVDTTKSQVAREVLNNGADMINDISGLTEDSDMWKVVKEFDCPFVIMHRLGKSDHMQDRPSYKNVVEEVKQFFLQQMDQAKQIGIEPDKIILDPGIGFGKTLQHNLELLRAAREFLNLGSPVMYGVSRKSMLGQIMGEPSPQKRLAGTLATSLYLIQQGVSLLRVHDVLENQQAGQVLSSILGPSAHKPL